MLFEHDCLNPITGAVNTDRATDFWVAEFRGDVVWTLTIPVDKLTPQQITRMNQWFMSIGFKPGDGVDAITISYIKPYVNIYVRYVDGRYVKC